MTVLFCTVFLLRGCYSELGNQRSPFSIVKMRKTSRLFILILAYDGGVGQVYSQNRGRGQRKIFWDSAPDPNIFCPPPPIKIPGGATASRVFQRKLPLKDSDSSPKLVLLIVGNLQRFFVLRLYSTCFFS